MSFLDFLLPAKMCLICGNKKAVKYGLCSDCLHCFEFIRAPICRLCGKPLNEKYIAVNSGKCPDCMEGRIFDEARSCVVYTEEIHDFIYLFKYKGDIKLKYVFGEMMLDALRQWHPSVDVIVPVPMHRDKLKIRGFNQAVLLSEYISDKTKIPYEEYIVKSTATWAQAKLGKEKRRANIAHSFKLDDDYQSSVKGKNILIVDDILTTVATAVAASL